MAAQISQYHDQYDERKNINLVYQNQQSSDEKISLAMMKRSIQSGIDIERLYQSGQELALDVVGCKNFIIMIFLLRKQ